MAVTFDTDTGEYLDEDGNPIDSMEQEESYVEETVALAALLALRMGKGDITPSTFGADLWALIVDAYLVSYLLGRGGVGNMADDDWSSVGDGVVGQREFLDNFVKQLAAGDMPEGTIRNRATLYILSSGAAYEMGRRRAKLASGNYDEELWSLGAAEHCSDCTSLNLLGWQPIGTLPTVPRAGATQCLSNCKCNIMYR